MTAVGIRAASAADSARIVALCDATKVFKPAELDVLAEVLDDLFAGKSPSHRALVHEGASALDGFVYFGLAEMTDRTWYLHWLAVAPPKHGSGLGAALLDRAEADARGEGARVQLIETSSLPSYEPARRFYAKHGYQVAGRLRDYYCDGDDMIVFEKRLTPAPERS